MLKILKIILVLSLQISIISTSFAEIKLRGPADGKYKIENKIFQITEEMLDDKAFQNLSDEIKQNSEIAKTLSKDNQIKDVIKLRGPGKNIFAQYEMGKTPIRAAIDGSIEVLPAIISAILTTVVAFSTFLFLDGRIGDFYFEVAIVVIVTLLVSLVEALVILPAHIAESRAMNKTKKGFLINKWADMGMSWTRENIYVPLLKL